MKWILIVRYYVTCSMTASLIEFFRVSSIPSEDRRLQGQRIPHVEFLVHMVKTYSTGFIFQF